MPAPGWTQPQRQGGVRQHMQELLVHPRMGEEDDPVVGGQGIVKGDQLHRKLLDGRDVVLIRWQPDREQPVVGTARVVDIEEVQDVVQRRA